VSVVTTVKNAVVDVVKREPVAVWGLVVAAVLPLLVVLGVPASATVAVASILSTLGVPVVRSKVSPVDAAKAVADGADGELDGKYEYFKVGQHK
jgi:hypothetical protein